MIQEPLTLGESMPRVVGVKSLISELVTKGVQTGEYPTDQSMSNHIIMGGPQG